MIHGSLELRNEEGATMKGGSHFLLFGERKCTNMKFAILMNFQPIVERLQEEGNYADGMSMNENLESAIQRPHPVNPVPH